jgi:hypothetical protein
MRSGKIAFEEVARSGTRTRKVPDLGNLCWRTAADVTCPQSWYLDRRPTTADRKDEPIEVRAKAADWKDKPDKGA